MSQTDEVTIKSIDQLISILSEAPSISKYGPCGVGDVITTDNRFALRYYINSGKIKCYNRATKEEVSLRAKDVWVRRSTRNIRAGIASEISQSIKDGKLQYIAGPMRSPLTTVGDDDVCINPLAFIQRNDCPKCRFTKQCKYTKKGMYNVSSVVQSQKGMKKK